MSKYRPKMNCRRLWRVWNLLFIVALYIYSTFHSISLYIRFKADSMDLAFGSMSSPTILNCYLACLIAGLTFIALSLYFMLFFAGNLADDGVRLGRDHIDPAFCCNASSQLSSSSSDSTNHGSNCTIFWARFRRNFLPFSSVLHIVSALCFLVPLPFVEAYQIRQRVVKPNTIWHSDLDFLFEPDSWHPSFSSCSTGTLLAMCRHPWLVRPQFVNLAAALLGLALRYPAVFWAANRGFSFAFSLLLVLAGLHILLDFSATSVLLRIAGNPDFVAKKLQQNLLSPIGLMLLSVSGSLILLVSFWTIFEFGWQQYREYSVRNSCPSHQQNQTHHQHQRLLLMMGSANGGGNTEHGGCNDSGVSGNCCHSNVISVSRKRKRLILHGYLPHVAALLTCALAVGLKIPLMYCGLSVIYKNSSDPMVLVNFVFLLLFVIVWFMTWFGFALKPSWRFTTNASYSKAVSEISSATPHVVTGTQSLNRAAVSPDPMSTTNQIYSCYHGSLDGHGMHEIEPRDRIRDYYGDETDLQNVGTSANYVYLQSNLAAGGGGSMQVGVMPQQRTESPFVTQQLHDSMLGMRPAPGAVGGHLSGSESSYDSASNIRNQILLASLDQEMLQTVTGGGTLLRAQQAGVRNPGVIKYSATSPTSQQQRIAEYLTLQQQQQQMSLLGDVVVGSGSTTNTSSSTADSSTLVSGSDCQNLSSAASTATMTSPGLSNKQPQGGDGTMMGCSTSASLQRQNSKKKMYGQRVTFKDEEHLQESVLIAGGPQADRSPNNSEEQDSNNTTSSDSGIDNTSRHYRAMHTSTPTPTPSSSGGARLGYLTPQPTPTQQLQQQYGGGPLDNTYYNFYGPPPSSSSMGGGLATESSKLIPVSQSIMADNQSTLSFVTESDQERLCSQV